MALSKNWAVLSIDPDNAKSERYGYTYTYATLDSAVVAAKQRTQKDQNVVYGVFELVQASQPIVPEISMVSVT